MTTLIRAHTFNHGNSFYLDHMHLLQSRISDIPSMKQLRFHIVIYHGMHVKEDAKIGDLAKIHLLYHAIHAYPELRESLKWGEDWGKAL